MFYKTLDVTKNGKATAIEMAKALPEALRIMA